MENEKLYIVVEECWEYNDEDYRQPNWDDAYSLVEPKLYTLEEAERLRDELNEKCELSNTEWSEELDDEIEIPIKPYKIIKLNR